MPKYRGPVIAPPRFPPPPSRLLTAKTAGGPTRLGTGEANAVDKPICPTGAGNVLFRQRALACVCINV